MITDCIYCICLYLPPHLLFLNRELHKRLYPSWQLQRSEYFLRRFVRRWHAAFVLRGLFVEKMWTNLQYRLQYLLVDPNPEVALALTPHLPQCTLLGWLEPRNLTFLRRVRNLGVHFSGPELFVFAMTAILV